MKQSSWNSALRWADVKLISKEVIYLTLTDQ